MRGLLTAGLSLSLGLLAGVARAEELQWRPATNPAAVSVVSGRAPAAALGRATALPAAPAAALGRPVVLGADAPAVQDRQFTPASFRGGPAADPRHPLVRAKAGENLQPMPVGVPGPLATPTGDAEKSDAGTRPFIAPTPTPVEEGSVSGFAADGLMGAVPGGLPVYPSGDLTPYATGPAEDAGGPAPGPCDESACAAIAGGCQAPRPTYAVWGRAEFLGWRVKEAPLPALVTASPAGTPLSLAGILGVPGTRLLYGGDGLDEEDLLGGRFTVGVWLGRCHTIGLEGSYLFIGTRTNNFTTGPGASAILARPFFDVLRGVENAELVAFPGVITGGITVSNSFRLDGAEANVRYHWCDGCLPWRCSTYHVDLLAGFRFLEMQERLAVIENLAVPAGTGLTRVTGPAGITVVDRFGTNNQFYGGQVGADAEFHTGRWFVGVTGKVGIGTMHQVVDINGSTTFAVPGLITTVPGGLLALPTNSGHFVENRFAYMSEGTLRVGYQFSDRLRAFVGYNILYMDHVVRPGDQVDRVVNVSQLPTVFGPGTLTGAARPAFHFNQTDFWAQGVSLGVEFRF